MTNEQILKKAIERAVESGYDWDKYHSPGKAGQEGYAKLGIMIGDYYNLIFSHDFAKAFWGEGDCPECKDSPPCSIKAWRYHLEVMVLEEDPIKYLEQFL